MSVRNSLLLLGTVTLLQACAAVSNPEGGPRDLENPKLLSTFPEDKAVNVNPQTIRLTFDEEVQAPNLNRQLQISPNTEPTFSVKANRNVIELTFDKPFEPNTTYQLNFRDGIVDITEGNKAQNVVLTFSTGTYLDSAQLSGSVINALTNNPESGITVKLYPETDTANIRQNKPFYYTQTDATGAFKFTNIKAGDYWIFAHRDKNNDQLYDNEAETIGYKPSPVTAAPADTTQKEPLVIRAGKADTRNPFILTKEAFTDNFALTYSEGIHTFTVTPPNKANVPTTVSPDGKVIRLFPATGVSSGNYIVSATDSAFNQNIDTVAVAFTGKRFFQNPGNYKSNVSGSVATDQPIELKFDVPFASVDPAAFTLIEDTVRTRTLNANEVTVTENKTTLLLTPRITARRTLTIQADSSKLISVTGQPVKIAPFTLTVTDQLPTGSLSGNIVTDQRSFQMEILNSNGQVVKTVTNQKTFFFSDLLAGTYTIRVKIDANNNGRWDGISKNLKTEPEPIYFHPEPVEIRANWEIEDYKISF